MKSPEEQLDEVRAVKLSFEELVKSDGWQRLVDFYRGHKVVQRNNLFNMQSNSMDDLIKANGFKDQLAGMDFIMGVPQLLIEEADLEEKALLQEIRDED